MENKILEIFDECINGKESCALCPYHGKEPYCKDVLGKDIMTYIETLKDQIEYYEEVIEEYEKAEHSEEEMYKPYTIKAVSGGTFYSKDWSMTLDSTASPDCYDEDWITTTSGSYTHAEGITTTASGGYACAEGLKTTTSASYAPTDGLTTTTSASSTDVKEYVLDSYQSLHDRVIAELEDKVTKPIKVEKWYKRE